MFLRERCRTARTWDLFLIIKEFTSPRKTFHRLHSLRNAGRFRFYKIKRAERTAEEDSFAYPPGFRQKKGRGGGRRIFHSALLIQRSTVKSYSIYELLNLLSNCVRLSNNFVFVLFSRKNCS